MSLIPRNPDRIHLILASFSVYWHEHPDMRLGQIIENANLMAEGERDLFMVEDDVLLAGLERLSDFTSRE